MAYKYLKLLIYIVVPKKIERGEGRKRLFSRFCPTGRFVPLGLFP